MKFTSINPFSQGRRVRGESTQALMCFKAFVPGLIHENVWENGDRMSQKNKNHENQVGFFFADSLS